MPASLREPLSIRYAPSWSRGSLARAALGGLAVTLSVGCAHATPTGRAGRAAGPAEGQVSELARELGPPPSCEPSRQPLVDPGYVRAAHDGNGHRSGPRSALRAKAVAARSLDHGQVATDLYDLFEAAEADRFYAELEPFGAGDGPAALSRALTAWTLAPMARPQPSAAAGGCEPLRVELPDVPSRNGRPQVPEIGNAEVLAPFFERAARLLRGWAPRHVRIAVYGDSNHTMDYITGRIRRRLQLKYGDAGHGFVALGRPWDHYQHMDVRHDGRSGFEVYAVTTNPVFDRGYGLSGIAAESLWRNATSWVATAAPSSPIGHTTSQVEVFYLQKPRFGPLEIRVDGRRHAMVDTRGPGGTLGTYRLRLPDGPHDIQFVAASGQRPVRLLGAVLERDEPGFVIDSFGVGALNTASLARKDPRVSASMLRRRAYDLVVFMVGANDEFTFDEAPEHMRRVIERHRQALPETPILIVSPPDRGRRQTYAAVPRLVEQRRTIAADNDCAFWNLWQAMGGEGSMARLRERGMARFDYIHFNEAGGAYVGDRLVYALWRELARYVGAHTEAGCDRSTLYDRE